MTSGPTSFPLFREEAMRHRSDHAFGNTLVMSTPIWSWAAIATVALLLGILTVLIFGTYGRRIEAVGSLTYAAGIARVAAPKSGVVSGIEVEEGQAVTAGQEMLVIATARSSTSEIDIDGSVVRYLQEERANLLNQLEAEEAIYHTNQLRNGQDRQASEASLESVRLAQRLTAQRLALAEAEYKRTDDLVKRQLLPRAALEKAEDGVAAARIALQQAEQQINDETRRLKANEADRQSLPLLFAKRRGELNAALSSISQRLTEAQSSRDLVVRAPVSGRVTGIIASLGESVSQGAPLLVVAPDGAALRAEVLVPARSAGFLKPGMEVRLSYDAFPYQKFGQYRGTVTAIGRNVLAPNEQTGPIKLNEPAFRVIVALDDQEIHLRGQNYSLRAGLTVRALLMQGDRRRIIEWLLEPFFTLSGSV